MRTRITPITVTFHTVEVSIKNKKGGGILRANLLEIPCNLRQNICRLFHVLALFPFTKSVSGLDYFQQEVNTLNAAGVTERNWKISRKH